MILDLTIDGTFSMAQARLVLRKISTDEEWPNVLRVRSIAAVTALAEVLYFGRASRMGIPVHIAVIPMQTRGQWSVELQTLTNLRELCDRSATARWQIERACDELKVQRSDGGDLLIMKLFELEVAVR